MSHQPTDGIRKRDDAERPARHPGGFRPSEPRPKAIVEIEADAAPEETRERESNGGMDFLEKFARSKKDEEKKPEKEGIILSGLSAAEEKLMMESEEGGGRKFWWGAAAGFVFLVVALTLVSTVFARVTLVLKPAVEKVAAEDIAVALDISVSKPLVPQRVIPAELLSFSKTVRKEFQATGTKMVEEKARGRVRIYNQYSSSSQGLVSTTRFLTQGGALYRLLKSVTVPGAKIEGGKIVPQFVEAELVADDPGEGSNASGEVKLSIPGF